MNEELGSLFMLIILTILLIVLVMYALTRRENQAQNTDKSVIETITDQELDSVEFCYLYNKNNRIIKIAQFSNRSDLRDDLKIPLVYILKSREVSGESKSIYFNQLLTRN
jgi:hypothetical protein